MVGDSILTPPPEDRWERNKRDDSRIRNQQYGFFRVAKEEIPDFLCAHCLGVIVGHRVRIFGKDFHRECFNQRCKLDQ